MLGLAPNILFKDKNYSKLKDNTELKSINYYLFELLL